MDQQHNDFQKDDPDSSGSSSANILNNFTVEEFEDNQPQQPSRSGITSAFVIDSSNRAHIVQRVSDQSSSSNSSFDSSEVNQPNRSARTSNWHEQPLRRSPRLSTAGGRTRESNFGIVVEEYDNNENSFRRNRRRQEENEDDDSSSHETGNKLNTF